MSMTYQLAAASRIAKRLGIVVHTISTDANSVYNAELIFPGFTLYASRTTPFVIAKTATGNVELNGPGPLKTFLRNGSYTRRSKPQGNYTDRIAYRLISQNTDLSHDPGFQVNIKVLENGIDLTLTEDNTRVSKALFITDQELTKGGIAMCNNNIFATGDDLEYHLRDFVINFIAASTDPRGRT